MIIKPAFTFLANTPNLLELIMFKATRLDPIMELQDSEFQYLDLRGSKIAKMEFNKCTAIMVWELNYHKCCNNFGQAEHMDYSHLLRM